MYRLTDDDRHPTITKLTLCMLCYKKLQKRKEELTSCSNALYSPSVCSLMMTKSRLLCRVWKPGKLLTKTTLAYRSNSLLEQDNIKHASLISQNDNNLRKMALWPGSLTISKISSDTILYNILCILMDQ